MRRSSMNFARLKSMDRKYWIAAGVVLLLVVVIFALIGRARRAGSTPYQTDPAKRGTLTSNVGATGTVHAGQSVLLTWQTSGRVDTISAAVGEPVKTDAVLAALAQDSIPQNIILAEADL